MTAGNKLELHLGLCCIIIIIINIVGDDEDACWPGCGCTCTCDHSKRNSNETHYTHLMLRHTSPAITSSIDQGY